MKEESVTVIIGWYGDANFWRPLIQRAVTSVLNQTVQPDKILISKGNDLQSARNVGLNVDSRYIIFLDADDELAPRYVESMLEGEGDIRVPSVLNFRNNKLVDFSQRWYTPTNLIEGQNYIVVAPLIRTSYFKQVGGFRNLSSLEDYDLWLRMEEAGAEIRQCTKAVYKIHQREKSRSENQNEILEKIISEAKQRRGLL